jgi:hypothetical protein
MDKNFDAARRVSCLTARRTALDHGKSMVYGGMVPESRVAGLDGTNGP